MKTAFFSIVITVLIVALIVTYLIRREERDLHRSKNVFIRLMQKFDSWQMLR